MSVIHAPEEKPVGIRTLIIPIVLLIAFLAFVLRLWYWQIVLADEYKDKVSRAGRLEDKSLAPRGRIYDRRGKIIAEVEPKLVVTVKPSVIEKDPDILDRLAKVLQVDAKKLKRNMEKQRRGNLDIPVFVGTTMAKAAQIVEAGEDLPSVNVVTQPMRVARDAHNYSHILGWVSVPTEKLEASLKEKGIEPAAFVGRDGLEQVYEEKLMGKPGSQVYAIDLARRPIRPIESNSPKAGTGLVLGIDSELQVLAQKLLGSNKGSIVALDPKTGEVLCMVSSPTFDLSIFEGGLSNDEFDFLYQNKERPMYKRAIAGLYPPGSTAKIMTTIAAAMAGSFQPSQSINCPGYLTMGKRKVRCENHGAGSLSFNMAFTKSCNTYFGKMAQNVGSTNMQKALHAMGIAEKTGIDINGEVLGTVPSEESIQKNHGRPWSLGDTNNIGIGQGDLLVTPLQMANISAMVANRGTIYKPHVVKAFVRSGLENAVNPVQPEILRTVDVPSNVWDDLQAAMRNVVVAGTGKACQIPGITVAGKSGSAENSQSRRTHAWFVGYAPYENPKIAFAVVVEGAGHGGAIAAPMARQIVQTYLKDKSSNAKKLVAQN